MLVIEERAGQLVTPTFHRPEYIHGARSIVLDHEVNKNIILDCGRLWVPCDAEVHARIHTNILTEEDKVFIPLNLLSYPMKSPYCCGYKMRILYEQITQEGKHTWKKVGYFCRACKTFKEADAQ